MKTQLDSTGIQHYFGFRYIDLLIPILLSVLLVAIYQFNFLLFHTLAETFAIVIAILLAVVSWYMYPFTRNNFLMYLGCGYIWVGVLDMLHTLAYEGMPIFESNGANISVQFWIGTRFIEAFLLLSAPWFLRHSLNRSLALFSYMLIAVILILAIFLEIFPVGYIEGEGLTTFKIISEYIIMSILGAAIFYLQSQHALIDKRILNTLILSISFTMISEFAFTFYVSVYGFSNMVGHIFKIFSYWFIFQSMIRATLQEPFHAMSRSASTYDAIPDATVVVDHEGIIRQANLSAARLAGIEVEELIGNSSHATYHPDGTTEEQCPVCQTAMLGKGGSEIELEVGRLGKWLSFSHSPILKLHGLEGSVEVIRDVTKKVESRAAYNKLAALKDAIVDNLPMMLFVKNAGDHRYVEWNKAAEELTGVSKEEMLGKDDYDFWPEEQADFFIEKDKDVLENGELLDIPQEPISTHKGEKILHTKKIPIYSKEGDASFLLGISEDITEKLQTEEMLRRSQKMDALGKLTGGIAHDYNNTLGVIIGFSELIKTGSLSEDKIKDFADQIHRAGERGAKLTQKLLSISKMKPFTAEAVDINKLINDEELMIERTLTARIKCEFDLAPDLWDVLLDQSDFEDSLLNISINAMHAIKGNGTFNIVTNNVSLSGIDAASLDVSEGDYVSVSFTDSGCGIETESLNRIFDPFVTSKGDLGTGLGLSQVYGFVQRSGGAITVTSEIGKGSQFTLYFPRLNEERDTSIAESNSTENLLQGNESILVVDDEASLQKLFQSSLTGYGYQVTCASTVEDALEILSGQHVDVIVSDVIMPGMNGFELAEQVRVDYPNIKVQLISGFNDKTNLQGSGSTFEKSILTKPFSQEDLAKRIRLLLDS
ncbi:MAG: PAS domain-containing protein [Sulfuriflexus sp.]|nr:PAS domain-containing protein [Sulfuriflexus sp.]